MKRVIAFSVCFIGIVFFVKALPFLLLFIPPSVGERLETWETTNTPFKIRIDRHAQANGNYFVPGAYYVFQSAASDSDQWREITTFRFDDPIDIPRNQVRFANEKVAYVFMIDMYAVTQDGGTSWNIYNIDNYLSKDEKCGSIEDLQIDAYGVGEVKLNCYDKQDSFKVLETTDFGGRWREK